MSHRATRHWTRWGRALRDPAWPQIPKFGIVLVLVVVLVLGALGFRDRKETEWN